MIAKRESRVKAIALLSGGLDSALAVKIIQNLGIDVLGLTFVSPFFGAKKAKEMVEILQIPHQVVNITNEIIEIVKNPKYGYGKNMNPCIDCHILMVKKAGELMEKVGASFIVSGEVLGERPKSQNRTALRIVSRESGYGDFLLRPLSAKLLPLTWPEKEGIIDRTRLLGLSGRSRKPQMVLARAYGIENYPTPAGGCLLTDPQFSDRLKNLFSLKRRVTQNDLEILKVGRNFFINGSMIVVSRNQGENKEIAQLAQDRDVIVKLKDFEGPLTLVRGEVTKKLLEKAAHYTARYSSKARNLELVEVVYWQASKGEKEVMKVALGTHNKFQAPNTEYQRISNDQNK